MSSFVRGMYQPRQTLLPEGKQIKNFRSDITLTNDDCNDDGIHYSITADQDASVKKAISSIPSGAWQPLHDRLDVFKTKGKVEK